MRLMKFEADWCGPCLKMRPVVDQISTAHGLPVQVVNVDKDAETTARYKVNGIPTLVLLDGDEEVARFVGAKPARIAEQMLGLT